MKIKSSELEKLRGEWTKIVCRTDVDGRPLMSPQLYKAYNRIMKTYSGDKFESLLFPVLIAAYNAGKAGK